MNPMLTWSLEPMVATPARHFLPVGAQSSDEGVVFRAWAPAHSAVRVVTGAAGADTRYVSLERDAAGFFTGRDEHGRPGDLYWFQLEDRLVPDPASRWQPQGVEGPSMVVAPAAYQWEAESWRRPGWRGRVIYELHVGTFTAVGTFRAAIERLDALAELGVNTIELMPVADFSGRWNWGYDGVMLFAPSRAYGSPDDLRALVDAAHVRGLAVVLDVVYNHLGPVGNVLAAYSEHYFHRSRSNPWGDSLNFDGPESAPVREFFLQNACGWLDEFRIDGLRLDAVHAIEDGSAVPIIAEIAAAARARGAFTIAEDERNDAKIVMPAAEGGWGVDAMWADDFHHTVRVAAAADRHAHFVNYRGGLDEWVATLRDGWLYHGQTYPSWRRPRGTDGSRLPPERFVYCISNHDQAGNRPMGDRLHEAVSPECYRAVSVFLCLCPYTPMLFMGQEWAASSPFPFFTDFPGELGGRMAGYRIKEFESRQAGYTPELLARMPNPQSEATVQSAKLRWEERKEPAHEGVLALYRECLRLRAAHAIFQNPPRTEWSVERVGDEAIALHWRNRKEEWLMIVSLKPGVHGYEASGGRGIWEVVLDSNERRFGGMREPDESTPAPILQGLGAVVFRRKVAVDAIT